MSDHKALDLPAEVLRRIVAGKGLQKEIHTLEAQKERELYALRLKYALKFNSVQQKVVAIANGDHEPSSDEIAAGIPLYEQDKDEDEPEYKDDGKVSDANLKGVPDFWLQVISGHPLMQNILNPEDVAPLRSLKNVVVEEVADKPLSFKLVFTFAKNDHFDNEVLTKTINYKQGEPNGKPQPHSTEGTKINWKSEKADVESFFDLFRTTEAGDNSEEQAEAIINVANMMMDDDMACLFKDHLIPHAVDWFTGKAMEYDISQDLLDQDPYGYEDDEDDEDDDEDDDDEE
ncbi:nucleosome assembly protein [Ramicandelaber brevisporus]|nr:nucleosome assembly protein [Ramicandelaber brevisporus]